MKNLLLGLMVLACTVSIFAQPAHAGGGKQTSKISVHNTNAAGSRAITVWVVKDGTTFPATKSAALKLTHKNVQAAKTEKFSVANGSFTIVAADTAAFNSLANTASIPAGSYATKTGVLVDKSTTLVNVKTVGTAFPFLPAIY
jgi:uncharacterized protein YfaS (alpha-2-macroglobulin family)